MVDCAHGATYKVAPAVLGELGADLELMGVSPNGTNINAGMGALYPEMVAQRVRECDADLGLAFDGDGDRLIMADENGNIIDGDQIMAICADHMMTRGAPEPRHGGGHGDVQPGPGDRLAGEGHPPDAHPGGRPLRGGGHAPGRIQPGRGEQSGHMVFLDHNTTGDGVLSALQVLAVMVRTGLPLSQLAGLMPRIPQVLINLKVREKKPLAQTPELDRTISAQEEKLGDRGRVLVRYSGTEPKLRIMVEAEDEQLMRQAAEEIRQAAVDSLGVAE